MRGFIRLGRPMKRARTYLTKSIRSTSTRKYGTLTLSEDLFDKVYSLNVKVPYFLVAELVPLMVKRGKGAIVNLSTMVADYGASGMSLYGSSKAAIKSV